MAGEVVVLRGPALEVSCYPTGEFCCSHPDIRRWGNTFRPVTCISVYQVTTLKGRRRGRGIVTEEELRGLAGFIIYYQGDGLEWVGRGDVTFHMFKRTSPAPILDIYI